jgi:hypothetical protein
MKAKRLTSSAGPGGLSKALFELISHTPQSEEPGSGSPKERAQEIARAAAMKAAGISGAMALPPGPLGLATILPDLLAIWHLQQGMVADIAAAYGKSAFLRKETMIYCLFKHGGAALMRDLVVRVGERYLVRSAAPRVLQQLLKKVGLRVTQRVLGRGISRWLPVVGALGMGAYAYYDTAQVAATAITLFSKELRLA